jgi:predicted esterase
VSAQPHLVNRRTFLIHGAATAGALLGFDRLASARARAGPEPGRLSARLRKATGASALAPGEHVLAETGDRRSILFVPKSFDPRRAAPFYLALHGATGSGDSMLRGTRAAAESHGVVVLSPSSHDFTWDAIRTDYADDFASIDKQLNRVFDQCTMDPRHVAIGGFSDGATYALSLGLLNGDLFTHIIAHSPGFIIGGGAAQGKPRVFISHGRHDAILPIDQCGRRIAAQLQRDGYRVRFDEFEGGHTATPAMRETAVAWFTG